ncbi:MAG: alpha/beta hydrolase [Ignavibacteriales bacterium]|nr:alpha/beta hydrolase [Ignavibacteriales bacterium]
MFKINKVSKLNKDIQLEEVYFSTTDSVTLYGWFLKHKNARGTFLYLGGDGFYLWNRLTPDVINTLTSMELNLMLIDYRGYGRSEGTPTIQGIYKDGYSAYHYLCSRQDIDSTRIIVYGHSLGTFVATRVGNTCPVAGVVLEGAISNTSEMRDIALKNNAPWYLRWLVTINADSAVLSLDNIGQVKYLKCPVLVVTGENDNITPPEMGKRIYTAAPGLKKFLEIIPKGEHKDLYFNNIDGRRVAYLKILSKYINSVLGEQKR